MSCEHTPLLKPNRKYVSVFNGVLASGVADALESEVNVNTLFTLNSGKTPLIPKDQNEQSEHQSDYISDTSLLWIYLSQSLDICSLVILPGKIFHTFPHLDALLFLVLYNLCLSWSFFGLNALLHVGSLLVADGGLLGFLQFAYPVPQFLATIFLSSVAVFTNLNLELQNLLYFSEALSNRTEYSDYVVLALISSCALLNAVSKKFSIIAINISSFLKCAVISFLLLSCYSTILGSTSSATPTIPPKVYSEARPAASVYSMLTLILGYSNFSWISVGHIFPNELRSPDSTAALRKVSKLAFLTTVVLTNLLYVAYFTLMNNSEIFESQTLVILLNKILPERWAFVSNSIIFAVITINNVLGTFFYKSRIIRAVATEGFFFRFSNLRRFTTNKYKLSLILDSLGYGIFVSLCFLCVTNSQKLSQFLLQFPCFVLSLQYSLLSFASPVILKKFHTITPPIPIDNWMLNTFSIQSLAVCFAAFMSCIRQCFMELFLTLMLVGIYWVLVVKILPKFLHSKPFRSIELLSDGTKLKKLEFKNEF